MVSWRIDWTFRRKSKSVTAAHSGLNISGLQRRNDCVGTDQIQRETVGRDAVPSKQTESYYTSSRARKNPISAFGILLSKHYNILADPRNPFATWHLHLAPSDIPMDRKLPDYFRVCLMDEGSARH